MSVGPEKIPEKIPSESLGSLRGCLVEGDAEQRSRERRIRRRALVLSILLQSAALTALLLIPLFGKTQRIAAKEWIPIPPYGHASSHQRNHARPTPPGPIDHGWRPAFPSPTAPPVRESGDAVNPPGTQDLGPIGNQSNVGPDCSWCVNIGGKDSGPRPPQPPTEAHPKRIILKPTQLDPAMLIHRVEPVYPVLAKQTHREGRVELRAIIGTDGTIQSLQIVASDPLFDRSALEAVQQWRYRPTVLNGQPVEIDTYITVIYSMPH
jgi:periplasmic protein TonB